MKKLINFTLIAIASLTVACHKDAALTRLQPVAFTGPLTASTNTVVVTPADTSATAVTFNWPAVTYPYKSKVTYTLQADLPADTVGATAWANAKSVTIGQDILTKVFTNGALNTLALKIGVPANDTGRIVFRVQAYQDRNAYSKAVIVAITTYQLVIVSHGYPVLYLPGFYQGWSPPTAGTVAAEQTGIYEGYIYMPASTDPSAYHFKFTSAPDWNHINYGDAGGGGKLSTDGTAGDLVLPAAGNYELVANTTTLTWTYTPVTWGIIGDATPGGWTADTQMSYNAAKQVWTVTANMLSTGSFKFRANDAWNIDFGIDSKGNLQYADNPAYPYNGNLNNLTVLASGNYTITLDLHDPNNYNYTLHKN